MSEAAFMANNDTLKSGEMIGRNSLKDLEYCVAFVSLDGSDNRIFSIFMISYLYKCKLWRLSDNRMFGDFLTDNRMFSIYDFRPL